MVFRKDEKRPELGVRSGLKSRTKWVFWNGSSTQEQQQRGFAITLSDSVTRQGLTNAVRTYRTVSSDTRKLHVESKDEH